MSCSLMNISELRLLEPEFIDLEPEYFDKATQISDPIVGENCQWQTYLHALALQGFVQWLGGQGITVDQKQCSLFQPQYANVITAVCNLEISDFKLCLIATENFLDEVVTIPRAVLDLPDFAAHFYVVLEVQEEQGQAILRGYGRHDQLASYSQRARFSVNQWNYAVPLFLFDAEPNHLVCHLRYLEAAAMPLPREITNISLSSLTQLELQTILSQLQSTEQSLEKSLPWEKGAFLLQNPKLLDLLYQWQQSSAADHSLYIRIIEVFTLLTQSAIDIAQWIRAEFDELSQHLGWSSQLEVASVSGFRSTDRFSTADRFRDAITELRYQGMDIPAELTPVFRTIESEGDNLQVCAATWTSITPAAIPRWTLLLILKTQTGAGLPDGLKLRIADLTDILSEAEALDTELLYVRADVSQDAKLVATIVSPTGQVVAVDSYRFAPTASMA